MAKEHHFKDNSSPYRDPEQYRRLVGRLLYLNMTRPHISYTVQQLSQSVGDPRDDHWHAANFLVQYLKGTQSMGIFYDLNGVSTDQQAFTDSDWAFCPTTK